MVAETYGFFGITISFALALGTFGLPFVEAYDIFFLLSYLDGVEKGADFDRCVDWFLAWNLLYLIYRGISFYSISF